MAADSYSVASGGTIRAGLPALAEFTALYDFPSDSTDAATNFPYSAQRMAWQSVFLRQGGTQIVEWGTNDHGLTVNNSIRLVPMPSGSVVFAYPNNNGATGPAQYDNLTYFYHPTEDWWFNPARGRFAFSGDSGSWTHWTFDGTLPTTQDWGRDDSTGDQFIGGSHPYNPAYDYCANRDKWLIIGGGAGSESTIPKAWVFERNPEYPTETPPWRIRDFTLYRPDGVTPVTDNDPVNGWVWRRRWRKNGAFRGASSDWFYVFGGISGPYPDGMVQHVLAHRINVVTGIVERLADAPAMTDYPGISYDSQYDVFVLALSTGVWVYNPATDAYSDVTPAGYTGPFYAQGVYQPSSGRHYFKCDYFNPAIPTNGSQDWKLMAYWWLKLEPVV